MGNVILQNLSHSYGENQVLKNVELEICQGEFFTLLGPSGCGKTTILRTLAGFLSPTEGKILMDGKDITKEPPEKRGMGVVFQNYALFPNMTVEENILYGMKVQRRSKAEMQEKCRTFLELTGLEPYRTRKIDQLSGGQQQRVAIARALIVEPKMLLLDEPLSNLDVALRVKMRRELQEIQRKTGVTTLFITHDQQEALSVSHRIAVMDHGEVQQVGTPDQVYNRPVNQFVADFVGTSNRITPEDCSVLGLEEGASLRPEQLRLFPEGQDGLTVTVEAVQFEGPVYHYTVASKTGVYQVLVLNRGGERESIPVGTAVTLFVWAQEER